MNPVTSAFLAVSESLAKSPGRASYNITDDRFKFWPAERLSPSDYAEAKACKFQWFPGQKCFSAIWRPQAEDLLARLGYEIADCAEVDDVAARVERFGKYADNAEETAERAAERLNNGDANTARRIRLSEAVAAREFSSAAHWKQRIAGAIRHAQFKENPGAIFRRIETLETDLRRHERAQMVDETAGDSVSVWVGGTGRGQGHYLNRTDLAGHLAWEKRWVDHLNHRLEYERARLAATGHDLAKMAGNEIVLEKGGAVRLAGWPVSAAGWYLITKVNPSTVEVYDATAKGYRLSKYVNVGRGSIAEIATPARVKSGEIAVNSPLEPKPSSQPKGVAKARDGKTPEKFGALGSSGGFYDKFETCTWYLITKVNRTTVEYLAKQQMQRGDKTTYWQYYIKKTEIAGIAFLKSPAEVKAAHPDLLVDWSEVERLRAKQAAVKVANLDVVT